MTSHSQHQEDRWIVEHLNLPDRGVFVEVGAFDGLMSSNTVMLEEMGWNGLLIEPDPFLQSKHSGHRPDCKSIACAIGTNTGVQPFYVNLEDRGLSGFKRPGIMQLVPVFRLDTVMESFGIGTCDFLSIDTEGTELDVWESIGEHRPSVVMIEYYTLGLAPDDQRVVERMTRDGYKEVHRTPINLIFTKA